MVGYKARWIGPTNEDSPYCVVINLQTQQRHKLDAERGVDNPLRLAAERVHGGEVTYIGEDHHFTYYVGKEQQ